MQRLSDLLSKWLGKLIAKAVWEAQVREAWLKQAIACDEAFQKGLEHRRQAEKRLAEEYDKQHWT